MNYKQKYLKHYGYGVQDFIPCFVCSKMAVDIHHVIFRSQGGQNKIENLVALCRDCHTKAHNNKEFNEKLKHDFQADYRKKTERNS